MDNGGGEQRGYDAGWVAIVNYTRAFPRRAFGKRPPALRNPKEHQIGHFQDCAMGLSAVRAVRKQWFTV